MLVILLIYVNIKYKYVNSYDSLNDVLKNKKMPKFDIKVSIIKYVLYPKTCFKTCSFFF